VDTIVDTTGAGDAYTAGFLYGLTDGQSLQDCARLGTFCATEIIQQIGARIEAGLLERYQP
jgi:sugar/nucleoside kinase (ribokinase family)